MAMGKSCAHQRQCLIWGAVLLLMIPSPSYGWNVPYFGSNDRGSATVSSSPAEAPGVRVDTPVPTTESRDSFNVPRLSAVTAPLMGPVDAPHLRYVPSYFSNQIPTKVKRLFPKILSKLHTVRLNIYHFLWYKPPVGIVGAWSFLRVMGKVSINMLYSANSIQ